MEKKLFFQHPQAIVESNKVGSGTRIWAFAHVLPGATIGKDCNICDFTFVENDVIIGDRVTVKCGVQLWDGIVLEDDVFVGPNVTFTNDLFPRSKCYPKHFARTVVRYGASIGANATILPGVTIGENAMIGAGSVVVKDVSPNTVVYGNPACVRKNLEMRNEQIIKKNSDSIVKQVSLPLIKDFRGDLSFAQYDDHLSFRPVRYFIISNVPKDSVRGGHAHKQSKQFMVCLNGSCRAKLDDGRKSENIYMDRLDVGLDLPAMVWVVLDQFSSNAVLLVLSSEPFSEEDYIRNYGDFLMVAQNK